MIKNLENQMNPTGYNPSIWNSDFLPNEYQIPSSPNPHKFNNLPNSFQVHAPDLIIHKSEREPQKKSFTENEEILPEFTLHGQLISIIRANDGKADFNFILEKIKQIFPHLRRINGRKYSGNLMKTVNGGLHSTEIFNYNSFNNLWELKEDLAKKYEEKTVQKFKVYQKKISKKPSSNYAIKKKLEKPDHKTNEMKRLYQDSSNVKSNEAPSNESFHNLKDFVSEGIHPNENSFNHAEFGNYLMNEGNEIADFKMEEDIPFEKINHKNSLNSFPILSQFNNVEENNSPTNMKNNEKIQIIKKKKRLYKRSYEKYNVAFKSLEKVVEYMLEKNYANLIKNPFTNLNGNESPEEIIQKIGTENIIGVVRCFDYFKALIMENLEKKTNKLRDIVVKGDAKKSNFLVNVAKDVSDIKNKLNNIFNHKN